VLSGDWLLVPDLTQLERGSDQNWTGADRAKVNMSWWLGRQLAALGQMIGWPAQTTHAGTHRRTTQGLTGGLTSARKYTAHRQGTPTGKGKLRVRARPEESVRCSRHAFCVCERLQIKRMFYLFFSSFFVAGNKLSLQKGLNKHKQEAAYEDIIFHCLCDDALIAHLPN